MNDFTVTRYRITIFEKTGIIKSETKFIKSISFAMKSFVGFNFRIEEPQNKRFYENCLNGLQATQI